MSCLDRRPLRLGFSLKFLREFFAFTILTQFCEKENIVQGFESKSFGVFIYTGKRDGSQSSV